ncbi:MAG: hypothetical protein O2954_14225 [bacterium]|nr:hypothetical protein [bacterium]
MEQIQVLQAHIFELEELVENLLADARSGDCSARELMVHLHREVMEKRQRLRKLYGKKS